MACGRFLFSVTLLKKFLDKRTLIAAGDQVTRVEIFGASCTSMQILPSESRTRKVFSSVIAFHSFFLIPHVVWPTNQRDKTYEELGSSRSHFKMPLSAR